MKSIRELRTQLDSALDKVQAKLEAAQVQGALGAMELEQRFGDQFEALRKVADGLGDQILELAGDSDGERLQQALDRLKVQVSLGAMDSRDALLAMKADLDDRLEELNASLDAVSGEISEEASDAVEKAMEAYATQAARMKAEIEARLDELD